jgi:hypothetical protein
MGDAVLVERQDERERSHLLAVFTSQIADLDNNASANLPKKVR